MMLRWGDLSLGVKETGRKPLILLPVSYKRNTPEERAKNRNGEHTKQAFSSGVLASRPRRRSAAFQ